MGHSCESIKEHFNQENWKELPMAITFPKSLIYISRDALTALQLLRSDFYFSLLAATHFLVTSTCDIFEYSHCLFAE